MTAKVVILSELTKCAVCFSYRNSVPFQVSTRGFSRTDTRSASFAESKG